MPGLDGLQVCRRVTSALPDTAVVIVTTFGDPDYVDEALDSGVSGFLLKDSGPALLVAALLARGHTNAELAAELFLSLSTVKTHLASIQRRLGARNRVEIAAAVWASGALDES